MVIAEIGTSHSGSLSKAKELIDAASCAGADAVKFQWVIADEILHPKTGFVDLPAGRVPLYERFRQLECPPGFYAECLSYARSKNVKWMCSPFGLKSLALLLELDADAIKIASPELNHFPMLEALQKAREPTETLEEKGARKADAAESRAISVILSSGVSTLGDIEAALKIVGTKNVSLLHCVTSYPAPEEEYNVRLVKTLSAVFGIDCGISDHSLDPILVPCLALSQGAKIIEKHITLSKTASGLDDPVALEPEEFLQMTQAARQCRAVLDRYGSERGSREIIKQMEEQFGQERVQKVLGSGVKRLAPSEEKNYGRTNRSLRYTANLEAGGVLQEKDVAVLRAEKILSPGISPGLLKLVVGKKLARSVSDGDGVRLEDFMRAE